jgi:hypothetical protein
MLQVTNPYFISGYFISRLTIGVLVQTISLFQKETERKGPDETTGVVEKTQSLKSLLIKERNGTMLTNHDRHLLNQLTRNIEVDDLSARLFLYLKRKESQSLEARKAVKPKSGYSGLSPIGIKAKSFETEEEITDNGPSGAPVLPEAQLSDNYNFEEEEDLTPEPKTYKKTRRSKRKNRKRNSNLEPIPDLIDEDKVLEFIDQVHDFQLEPFSLQDLYDEEEQVGTGLMEKIANYRSLLEEEDDELEELPNFR